MGFSIGDVATGAQQAVTIAYLGNTRKGALVCKRLVVRALRALNNIDDTLSCTLNSRSIMAGYYTLQQLGCRTQFLCLVYQSHE